MDKLLRTLLSLKEAKTRRDDDFSDRLSRQYTTGLFVVFALVVSTKQFVGDPISCWCPATFTDSHRQYANTICWISTKFYVPFDERIPSTGPDTWRGRQRIGYYQWIPLFLLVEALLSFLPTLLWRFLNIRSGIDLSAVLEAGVVCQRASYVEIRTKTVRYMVNQIDRYLLAQRDYHRGCCYGIRRASAKHCFLIGGKRQGNYLTVSYLLVKLVYLLNAVGQLFLLDLFLGIDYHVYGVRVVARVLRGDDSGELSQRFPRVTLCNFDIRHQGRVHDYVVQCALTINIFNEKIFIIVWFWLVAVAAVTLVSCLQWVIRSLHWRSQIHYVKKQLRAFDATATVRHRGGGSGSKANLAKFVQYYLRRDGLFILRMIALNIGEMVAAETLLGLWENYGPDRRIISEQPPRARRPNVTEHNAPHRPTNLDVV